MSGSIVVVENRENLLSGIRTTLALGQWEMIEIDKVTEALQQINARCPCLMILGMDVPGAVELLAVVRQKYSLTDLPIICILGNNESNGSDGPCQAYFDMGVNMFYSRAINPKEMAIMINKLLDWARLNSMRQ